MDFYEKGLMEPSHMHFYPFSGLSEGFFLLPLCAGEFFCGPEYRVERDQYPSFLLLYVEEGEIVCGEEKAHARELLPIDCYAPHRYGTETKAHTLWLHFDGEAARGAFEAIRRERGTKIACSAEVPESMRALIEMIRTSQDAFQVSQELYRLLCLLMRPAPPEKDKSDRMEKAKEFFRENFDRPVGVDEAAKAVNLAPSSFSRRFRAAFGVSPYAYLLAVRLERAREMLLETSLPVSEVAYRTGFGSDSCFIAFFKKETGLSPLKFRKMRY
ncbi:MAG: helix-turn-helix transcriptional regulator [Clostridia bacterium]|nr:helix-turn-helix transcriptional regulator [Clostridia bacterium]